MLTSFGSDAVGFKIHWIGALAAPAMLTHVHRGIATHCVGALGLALPALRL